MKELHKQTLKKAARELPTYQPDEQLWLSISQELKEDAAEKTLQIAIRQLPTYEPSDALWNRIEAAWKQPGQLTVWRKRIAIAASICLAVVLSWWLLPQKSTSVKLVYATEIVPKNAFETNWNEDADAFALLATLCEQQQFICEQPHFQTLQNELEELNSAKEEVQTAIDRYGEQQRLLQQLARIERERSDVLKELVREI